MQLPNQGYSEEFADSWWAELREAQLLTLKTVPNTGLAVTIDLGEAENLHPPRKEEIGSRLALWALATTYRKKVEHSGPLYEGMKIDNGEAHISFAHVGAGLEAHGQYLKGFTIAGADKKFHRATARIEGDTIIVSSADVSAPVAVRYAGAIVPTVICLTGMACRLRLSEQTTGQGQHFRIAESYGELRIEGIPMKTSLIVACNLLWVLLTPSASHSQSSDIPHQLVNSSTSNRSELSETLLPDPIWVYNNWSSYDELSDNMPQTEELAMRELDEIVRLKKYGVHFDYYMMDAFWFDPDGGYRKWRKPNWPDGPDRWIASCQPNGLKPGMWFGTNALVKINPAPQWKDSLTAKGGAMSFSEGGFLPDFMDVLQYWYDHGIRMFKFDFVYFDAATPANERALQ